MRPKVVIAYADSRAAQQVTGYPLRNLSEEAGVLQRILKNTCDIIPLPAATLQDIFDAFDTHGTQIKVFHYAGHAHSYGLLLAEENTHGKNLSLFLSQQKGLELVFLNGCSTEEQAKQLRKGNIPCVIATKSDIGDTTARIFAEEFYRSLVKGITLQTAFSKAIPKTMTRHGKKHVDDYRSLSLDEEKNEVPWEIFQDPDKPSTWKFEKKFQSIKEALHQRFCIHCDRREQLDLFKDVFDFPHQQHPNICILSGDAGNHPELTIQKFQAHVGQKPVNHYNIESWPTASKNLRRRILTNTFKAFQLAETTQVDLAKADHILTRIPPHSISFISKTIYLEDWDEDNLQELEWYINVFWKANLELPAHRNKKIFLFLIIITPKQSGLKRFFASLTGKSKMEAFLKKLEKQLSENDYRTILPPLKDVSWEELLEFALSFKEIEITSESKLSQLLPKRRPYSMGEIMEKIKDFVEQVLEEGKN